MHKADLLARDVFPGWMRTGPWPYEVGMVCLLAWMVWCLLHGGVLVPAPNGTRTAFAAFVSGNHTVHSILAVTALALMAGMVTGLGGLLAGRKPWANKVRGASIIGAAIFSAGVALLFFLSVNYPISGGMAAFISWRAFCVGVRLWWEPNEHAQPSG